MRASPVSCALQFGTVCLWLCLRLQCVSEARVFSPWRYLLSRGVYLCLLSFCLPFMQGSTPDEVFQSCQIGNSAVGSLEVHLKAFALLDGAMDIDQVAFMMQSLSTSSTPCRDLQNGARPREVASS